MNNVIVVYQDHAEIVLVDNKTKDEVGRALIDVEDVVKVTLYKWTLRKDNGYICNRTTGIYLHRYIMGVSESEYVDHKYHNKLDNRKENLRVCTNSQNNMNKGLQINSKSGVTGVYWSKREQKWRAKIKLNGKDKHLGYFIDFEDAVRARKEAEIKYFGEYRFVGIGDK